MLGVDICVTCGAGIWPIVVVIGIVVVVVEIGVAERKSL